MVPTGDGSDKQDSLLEKHVEMGERQQGRLVNPLRLSKEGQGRLCPLTGELTLEVITHAISKAYKSFQILKQDHH